MELQQLTCPQLLSENILREILKNSCIEVANFETLNKIKLIEIFERVALPLPQRNYNDKPFEKKLKNLRLTRGIKIVDYDETNTFSITGTESPKKVEQFKNDEFKKNGRLKPPMTIGNQLQKRIRLSSSGETEGTSVHSETKRKNEVSLEIDSSKRQKITWP